MTSRTADIHCDRCGKYLFSLQPMEPLKGRATCIKYGRKCWPQRIEKRNKVRRADSGGANG